MYREVERGFWRNAFFKRIRLSWKMFINAMKLNSHNDIKLT